MANVTNDEVDVKLSDNNVNYDFSGSTLIQPEKQIQLDIGNQQNYTVLPALREDVYTISAVGDINGLLSDFPVPHNWQPVDGSGTYEVDRWAPSGHQGGLTAAEEVSSFIRNALFNSAGSTKNFNAYRRANQTPHEEMYSGTFGDPRFYTTVTPDTADQRGVMQKYAGDEMVATRSLFNEYLTDDGLNSGSATPDGILNSGAIGTMYGQVQEALISWFEAANYKDFTDGTQAGYGVDPRKHDILRSWMSRGRIDQRHLAKMNSSTIEKLIATNDATTGKVDEGNKNTLAYCCFDADQVKQIFSTIEMTGRIRVETSGSTPPQYLKDNTENFLTAASGTSGFHDDGGSSTQVLGHDGVTQQKVPRHKVALRHGEGFAIVVPAKTQLRSGTVSEANLMVRIFQSHDGQAVATDSKS